MSLNNQLIFMGENDNIAIFNNGKILLIFDQDNIKAVYNYYTDTKMVHSLVQEIDGFRLIGEEHILYREVNAIYQELVCLESLDEAQQQLFGPKNTDIARDKLVLKQKLATQRVEES